MSEFTAILDRAEHGDVQAREDVFSMVYDELRRLAAGMMAREMPGRTLQATALVHEAWLRLGAEDQPAWQNRGHFFAAAGESMRRILVEQARRRCALKRGGGESRMQLDDLELAAPDRDQERILQVNEALEKLARIHPDKATLVKLRFFAGLTYEEAALALGIGVPTAKDWWKYSRAWLMVEMGQSVP